MRKRYTAKKKAQIVLEILKEERSIAQIASVSTRGRECTSSFRQKYATCFRPDAPPA
jgi:transposase-like protein